MINPIIQNLVTEENLLFLALDTAKNIGDEDHPARRIADDIIIGYIIYQLGKDGSEFTEEDIQREYGILLASHILNGMTEKGLLEAKFKDDGEVVYEKTELGKQVVEELRKREDLS